MFIVAIAILAVIVAALIGGMYLVLTNFTPGESKIASDVEQMRAEMQPWIDELVPWKASELDLLSIKGSQQQIKKGIVKTAKGVLTSIYQEPLVAYSFKQYFGERKNGVLLAQLADKVLEYRVREHRVEVRLDGEFIGDIENDGQFYDSRTKQLTASINRSADELTLPIIVKGRDVAGLVRKDENAESVITDRAFEYVNAVDRKEETLILSMAIWEVLREELPLPVKVKAKKESKFVE